MKIKVVATGGVYARWVDALKIIKHNRYPKVLTYPQKGEKFTVQWKGSHSELCALLGEEDGYIVPRMVIIAANHRGYVVVNEAATIPAGCISERQLS